MTTVTSRAARVCGLLALAACAGGDPEPVEPLDTGVYVDPAATVTGTVTSADGPVVGAHVTVVPHGYEATTGSDGSFAVTRLPAGTYEVVVAADGYVTARADAGPVEVDEVADVTVTLEGAPPEGAIEIALVGPTGAPVAGATITWGTATTTTDASGRARLAGLEAGTADLVATADDLWPYTVADLAVGAATVQVAHTLSGRPPVTAHEIGTRVCLLCHYDNGHPDTAHARAFSTSTDPTVLADFAGTVALAGGTATLSVQGEPVVQLTTTGGTRTFSVDGWIGDPTSGTVPFTEVDGEAWALPVAYVAARPGYLDWPDAAARWVAYDEATWIDGGAFTFPDGGHPDASRSADARCLPCHTSGHTVTPRIDGGVDLASTVGTADRWGEAGVGCERCHGPGSAHFSALIVDKPLSITNPARLDPGRANDVCGACHSAVEADGLPYPHPFTPGQVLADHASPVDDLWGTGAAAAPGQQLDELKVSPHAALRCDDCHTMHGSDAPGALYYDARDNTACLSCHLGLSFDGDPAAAEAHPNHIHYLPSTDTESGRCTGCHMPKTTARLAFQADSGAGDLQSHLFVALSPQTTLDVFGAAETLPLGSFPTHACAECHAWGAYRWESHGNLFPGVFGDPTLAATHREHATSYAAKFP